jgi:hypothetical protein
MSTETAPINPLEGTVAGELLSTMGELITDETTQAQVATAILRKFQSGQFPADLRAAANTLGVEAFQAENYRLATELFQLAFVKSDIYEISEQDVAETEDHPASKELDFPRGANARNFVTALNAYYDTLAIPVSPADMDWLEAKRPYLESANKAINFERVLKIYFYGYSQTPRDAEGQLIWNGEILETVNQIFLVQNTGTDLSKTLSLI